MKLKSLDGESISDMWTKLSDGSCDALLTDCLQAKKDLMLNDWGYIMWLQHVSRGIIKDRNMTVLMEQWLLTQSGYRARMAMTGSGLLLIFMPFDVPVFETPYIILDEEPFFLVTSTKSENNELQVFDHAFPGENTASLRVAQLPKLANKPCERRTLASKAYPAMAIQTTVNKNLIDYCNHYPKVAGSWDIYANASLSEDVKRMIYPRLTKIIKGLDEKEQAEVLLNWIQTAFEYKTDEDQFGGERSLFADETLYYPYCDCEDRSILLSILIHDLMGLDVVLLHFPGHLATAVKFSTHVEGDYLDLEDGTYIVCDPTYINAPVGMAMPDCKEQEVTVFRILRRQ